MAANCLSSSTVFTRPEAKTIKGLGALRAAVPAVSYHTRRWLYYLCHNSGEAVAHWIWHRHLKPSDTFSTVRSHFLFLPNSSTIWGPCIQISKLMGTILIQTTTVILWLSELSNLQMTCYCSRGPTVLCGKRLAQGKLLSIVLSLEY